MILIKYATKGRPELFKKAINNILDTIGNVDFKVLVTADDNDHSMCNDDIFCYVSELKNVDIIYGFSGSKIAAINRDMDNSGDWDILINMSDDMVFTINNWGDFLLNKIKETWGWATDFFAHFNDGYVGEALPTMSIIGREYYDRTNYIYHPSYKSFSCDAEAMFVAMMLGKHKYFNDVFFTHEHPAYTNAKKDETYRINSKFGDVDTKNYFERLNNYFDIPEAQRICVPFEKELGRYA